MHRTTLCGATAVLLTLAGLWLLLHPDAQPASPTPAGAVHTNAAGAGSGWTATRTSPAPGLLASPSPPPTPASPVAAVGSRAAAHPSVAPSGVLAPADGPAADATVQQLLEQSSPRNLPVALEQQLATLAARVWLADLTGEGRNRWPTYFTQTGSSGYTHTRIQAAIARATGPRHATATVLWAGTTPAGDTEVGLTGTVHLAETTDHQWEPVP
ncbi:hypothetical protein [Streptacidiphilus monticola]|uniref:Uncharacterized protein n=1 Tax=Streptacidiphilus monticola TaxID=2161674 RepID=A0ABW1GDV1_9ACTN